MQILCRYQMARLITWASIVFVLLTTGQMRVFDGFQDITDEYYSQLETQSYETQNADPEEDAPSSTSRSDDPGVLQEPAAVRRNVYTTRPIWIEDARP